MFGECWRVRNPTALHPGIPPVHRQRDGQTSLPDQRTLLPPLQQPAGPRQPSRDGEPGSPDHRFPAKVERVQIPKQPRKADATSRACLETGSRGPAGENPQRRTLDRGAFPLPVSTLVCMFISPRLKLSAAIKIRQLASLP